MAASPPTLSLENEVFSKFIFYAGILLFKTCFMSIWTARFRLPRKVFLTPEDYGSKIPATLTTDPDVERTRRCHQNDLENVLPFVLLGLLYVLIRPDVATATLVFRIFTGARLLHTFVYMFVVPQPSRVLTFIVGFAINMYMAVKVISAGTF